ncbi:hypothetical protein GCM10010515_51750 [Streptomyces fructofermentans]|uniref:Uncharacterized protein n=1 Tax=Streptomyces fructofermentans TaxID=152141 RepID=A0A918KUE8_9ACTN|nr:hypothetical protein GCM10010515_51750 [Streptomyces fructofermentans]
MAAPPPGGSWGSAGPGDRVRPACSPQNQETPVRGNPPPEARRPRPARHRPARPAEPGTTSRTNPATRPVRTSGPGSYEPRDPSRTGLGTRLVRTPRPGSYEPVDPTVRASGPGSYEPVDPTVRASGPGSYRPADPTARAVRRPQYAPGARPAEARDPTRKSPQDAGPDPQAPADASAPEHPAARVRGTPYRGRAGPVGRPVRTGSAAPTGPEDRARTDSPPFRR